MKNRRLLAVVSMAACALAAGIGMASRGGEVHLEGTYILDYREMPDGTKMHAPDIVGMFTYTREYRNFNVCWTEKGKKTSISVISKYTANCDQYTEENVYSCVNDEASGKGPMYDTAATKGASPVAMKDGVVSFQMPLRGEPSVVFDAHGLTATRKGAFTDHWKKIN